MKETSTRFLSSPTGCNIGLGGLYGGFILKKLGTRAYCFDGEKFLVNCKIHQLNSMFINNTSLPTLIKKLRIHLNVCKNKFKIRKKIEIRNGTITSIYKNKKCQE
jgi:hypothetical protein